VLGRSVQTNRGYQGCIKPTGFHQPDRPPTPALVDEVVIASIPSTIDYSDRTNSEAQSFNAALENHQFTREYSVHPGTLVTLLPGEDQRISVVVDGVEYFYGESFVETTQSSAA
jgi:hypothetical protein